MLYSTRGLFIVSACLSSLPVSRLFRSVFTVLHGVDPFSKLWMVSAFISHQSTLLKVLTAACPCHVSTFVKTCSIALNNTNEPLTHTLGTLAQGTHTRDTHTLTHTHSLGYTLRYTHTQIHTLTHTHRRARA